MVVNAYTCRLLHTLLHSLTRNEHGYINDPVDDEGTTLLHLAANCKSPDIMQLLLENDANVDWQNEDGLTALHVAAMWGRDAIACLLLEYGASPCVSDEDGMLPVDYARKEGAFHITLYYSCIYVGVIHVIVHEN